MIQVLIFSGSNNHNWQQTTPYLEILLSGTGMFGVQITNRPDTLKESDLNKFDVILSNWNSWPENELRWPETTEKALLNFIKKGGGFVTFHASTSAFNNWPEFQEISSSAWILDSTWHGKNSPTKIIIENDEHPVTNGLSGFFIFDELWINAGKNEKFEILGSATNEDFLNKGMENQPAIMVSEFGKGRIFHTILGHDVRAMRNTGFQTLLRRAVEWAATGEVAQILPQELSLKNVPEQNYSWQKSDTTFALLKGENMVWQYNFNTKHGRPFFHPVYAGRNNLTCLSPVDHRWHLGQWFCWKYINGVNYWEYLGDSFNSAGKTEIQSIEIISNPDYSAEINMEIVYHPVSGENVLAEKRVIKVSPPQENGNIQMDYNFVFEALADTVLLDRTPIEGEPDGKSWGGYAGLSIRFNQDFTDSRFISAWGDHENINGKTGDWLYMGFKGLDGKPVGTQIMVYPEPQTEGAAWYSVNTGDLPFYYFSPAVLYKKSMMLLRGEKLHLNYRIVHHNAEVTESILKNHFMKFSEKKN
ncbi:MAG: PmoA family protein [Mariniphaga sp.]|nr:PmoA family protein [Mariniphaga sp.]